MKIGLALSGGGARGFSHVGVAKILIQNGIPIDLISGTSAGSIIGALIAAGMDDKELEKIALSIGWLDVMRPSLSPTGTFSNAPLGKFISRHLKKDDFDALKIPFTAVAWDISSSQRVILDKGRVSSAVRASCAVPGVFACVKTRGRMLVDGGITEIIPIRAVREMGADRIISVDLIGSGITDRKPLTALGVLTRAAMGLMGEASRETAETSDVLIIPPIGHLRPDQIKHRRELIELGEKAAIDALPQIKKLLT